MIKNLSIALVLVFATTTAGEACSYHIPPNFSFQYETLQQGTMNTTWGWREKRSKKPLNELLSNLDMLYVARPAEDKILTELPDTWPSNSNDKREYRRIRWDVLHYLKGSSPEPLYVRRYNGIISPILSQDTKTIESNQWVNISQPQSRQNFIEAVEKRVNNRNSFAFWDAPVLKDVKMVDVTQFTSCGEVPVPAFDFNRFYIVGVDKNGATAFAEPLSDENDPLVAGFKRVVKNGPFSPEIPLEKFLTEMEFRDVVEIKSCGLDLQNRNATSKYWVPYSEEYSHGAFNSSQFKYGQEIKFSRVGSSTKTDIDIEDLSDNYPALLEYFGKDKSKVQCMSGETFAVYRDADGNDTPSHFSSAPTIPKYRFARVKDGTVRVDDIITNYTLTGPTHISISDFRHPTVQP